ncbi:hypothetical protein [Catenulispora rubra]|uniref:hypothetical protein n=1 Tax=Catenulispora rubra TaxID=280293 RepID=UPI00189269E5|nr:hypothetical protein [Catenulispora rubra]
MGAPLPEEDRDDVIARLRRQLVDNGTAPEARGRGAAGGGDIPLHPLLRPLVPGGLLARGTIVTAPARVGGAAAAVAADEGTAAGDGAVSYVTLALVAGATAGGAWAGVVGFPNFGIAAASGLGADLSKMLLLDDPGERWLDAAAVLAGAVDLVLLHTPRRPNAAQLRRMSHRVRPDDRQRGCVLVVTGPWETAHLTLTTHNPRWEGLGDGTGNLTRRRVTISATGRATRGYQRDVDLWLPSADGTIGELREEREREQAQGQAREEVQAREQEQEQPPGSEKPRLRIA